MTYLIRMITPPGGIVLDPFLGSGSTGVAAVEAGFQFIGIEREKEYVQIAEKRIYHKFPLFRKDVHMPIVDETKARAAQLSFKKSSEGLSPEEEQELDSLRKKMSIHQALLGGQSDEQQGNG